MALMCLRYVELGNRGTAARSSRITFCRQDKNQDAVDTDAKEATSLGRITTPKIPIVFPKSILEVLLQAYPNISGD